MPILRRRLLAQTSRRTLAAFDYGWPTVEEAINAICRYPRAHYYHDYDYHLNDVVVRAEVEPRERRVPGTFTPEPFYPEQPSFHAARLDR